jgi:hypothetical protein
VDDHLLVAQSALQNRAGRVNDEVIGVDRSGHHRLAQAGTGINDRVPAMPSHRVGGEEHPRDLRLEHPLDNDREPHGGVVDAVGSPVTDRPVGPQ